MSERIAINVRVIGYTKSDMSKKTEFSIVECKTIDGANHYKGLLDNGTLCPVVKDGNNYIADNTINPMCEKCKMFKKSCTGTFNKDYNSCIYKRIFWKLTFKIVSTAGE